MLGPVRIGRGTGRLVGLRPPAAEDAERWSLLMRADEAALRPWWPTVDGTWAEHTTQGVWWERRGRALRAARRGFATPFVVVADGEMVGEMGLDRIDRFTGTAELGGWVASGSTGLGVAGAALRLLLGHAFGPVRLRRLVAPIGVGNRAAAVLAARVGFRREGVLRDHLHAGGEYKDHELWALLTADFV